MSRSLLATGALCLAPVSHPAFARMQSVEEVRSLIADGKYSSAVDAARTARTLITDECSVFVADLECLQAEAMRRGPARFSAETLELAERAVSLLEELHGSDHVRTIDARLQLGALYSVHQEYARARAQFERVDAISHRAFGSSDPRRAMALSYLAHLTFRQDGDAARGLSLIAEAQAIQDNALPTMHVDRAFTLDMEATILAATQQDEAACDASARALAIRRSSQRPDHPVLANAVSQLASMQQKLGDLAGAQSGYEELAALLEGGAEIPALPATLYTNLGVVLHETGQWEDAEKRFRSALIAHDEAGSSNSSAYGELLEQLGRLAFDRGDYDEARSLVDRALTILRTTAEDEPDGLAAALLLGAWIEMQAGRTSTIESTVREVRELAARAGAIGLDWTRQTLELDAMIAARSGDHARAESLYLRAVEMERAVGGEHHAELARTLRYAARAAYSSGDQARALAFALEAEDIAHAQWIAVAPRLTELFAIGLGESRGMESMLEAGLRRAADTRDAREAESVWTAVVRRRDRAFMEAASRAALLRATDDPELRRAARSLSSARRRLAGLHVRRALAHAGNAPSSGELEEARAERAAAERVIATLGAARSMSVPHDIDMRSIRDALPAHAALVSYVVSRQPSDETSGEWIRALYVLVLQSPSAAPTVIALGDIDPIARLIRELDEEGRAGADEARWIRVAMELRRRIWDPVASCIGPTGSVFLVLEGELQRIPFTALTLDDSTYLVESGPTLHVLDSERTLLERTSRTKPSGLLAVADPTQDIGAGSSRADEELLRGDWPPLPEARNEVAEIRRIWADGSHADEEVELCIGGRADVATVRERAGGRRVIHFATHGYYEPVAGIEATPTSSGVASYGSPISRGVDAYGSPTSRGVDAYGSPISRGVDAYGSPISRGVDAYGSPISRGVAAYGSTGARTRVELVRTSEPMLRSGLVLASPSCADGDVDSVHDDGILTAEEVLDLPLDGVEWIVLSACDSALGELRSGESILGLRRAFRIAGARTVISSVWPVEDGAAHRWMRALYTARCREQKSTAESMRAASASVLASLRRSRASTHPREWASFIATGDWR